MKRIIFAALGLFAAAFLLLGCAGGTQAAGSGAQQIANPFEEYETLEQAQQAAGFEMALPEDIAGCDKRIFRVNKSCELLEVICSGEGTAQTVTIRKAAGDGDVSGDYNNYAYTAQKGDITLKGESSSACSLAVWAAGGYAYSVSVSEAVSQTELLSLAEAVA